MRRAYTLVYSHFRGVIAMSKKLKRFLFILLSCVALPIIYIGGYAIRDDQPKPVKMTAELQKKVMKSLAKKHQMEPSSVEYGMPEGVVSTLGAGFHIYRPLSQEEIRLIVVDSVQTYIKAVNEEEALRPYLKNFPFTEKNVSIQLIIFQKDGNLTYHPEVGAAITLKGNIHYFTNDIENRFKYKSEYEESYDEASQIVVSQATVTSLER